MITRFDGEYRFLSNFWPAEVELDGVAYPTVEHAYQAAKTTDQLSRSEIRQADSPGAAKRLARWVKKRDDWDNVKLVVMFDLLWQKFNQPALGRLLLATGEAELVEGNHWGDVYWGVCRGVGENHLGRLLMEIRAQLERTPHS